MANEYVDIEPENCSECGSRHTEWIDEQVIPPNCLVLWCECNACHHQWMEIIDVKIEIKFNPQILDNKD